jgi:hypothetical protein
VLKERVGDVLEHGNRVEKGTGLKSVGDLGADRVELNFSQSIDPVLMKEYFSGVDLLEADE